MLPEKTCSVNRVKVIVIFTEIKFWNFRREKSKAKCQFGTIRNKYFRYTTRRPTRFFIINDSKVMSHRWNSPFINSYWIKVLESFSILHFVKSEILFFSVLTLGEMVYDSLSHCRIKRSIQYFWFFSLALKKLRKIFCGSHFVLSREKRLTRIQMTHQQYLKLWKILLIERGLTSVRAG